MRLGCACGQLLSNGRCPNEIEYDLYTEQEWKHIAALGVVDVAVGIPRPYLSAWLCPDCKRIYIFESGNLRAIRRYTLEASERKMVFRSDAISEEQEFPMEKDCVCGKILSDRQDSPALYRVYGDEDWERITVIEMDAAEFPRPLLYAWYCSDCQRIYVFERENPKMFSRYCIEDI